MNEVEQAIEASYWAAKEDWRNAAEKRMDELSKRRTPFTSEDIIRYLEFRGLETPNLSALGGMFKSRSSRKLIKPVGWQMATRKARHNAPLRVWVGTL